MTIITHTCTTLSAIIILLHVDLTITTKKLTGLFATMKDYMLALLGLQLRLPVIKRDEVKRNFHSPSQRREAYLDLYATDHPCPRWSQVAEALHGTYLSSRALMVENTYVQGKISAHMFMYGCSELQTHVSRMYIQSKDITLLTVVHINHDNMPDTLNKKVFVHIVNCRMHGTCT